MNSAMSKVSPIEITPTKHNNFIDKGGNIIQQLRYLIWFETIFGVNRLYLCDFSIRVHWLSYVYSSFIVLQVVVALIMSDIYTASQLVYKDTAGVEYLLLSVSALFMQRKKLKNFFKNLQSFDEALNIQNEITSSVKWYIVSICAAVIYLIMEYILCLIYIFNRIEGVPYSAYLIYFTLLVHDCEVVFFCTLINMILKRLRVLKAHVAKIFSLNVKEGSNKINNIEALSDKVNLDVSSLHKLYDLLHNCSSQLSHTMSFPIIIILLVSGLSTIMLLKNLIGILTTSKSYLIEVDKSMTTFIFVFAIGRCLKYTLLIMFPCYFCNITKTQVTFIRTMIHDTLNTIQLDKIERRKLKAFFQLTRDNEFTYALCGVVNLDMSLPLSYSSLCTTYLIIVVQFSRFID